MPAAAPHAAVLLALAGLPCALSSQPTPPGPAAPADAPVFVLLDERLEPQIARVLGLTSEYVDFVDSTNARQRRPFAGSKPAKPIPGAPVLAVFPQRLLDTTVRRNEPTPGLAVEMVEPSLNFFPEENEPIGPPAPSGSALETRSSLLLSDGQYLTGQPASKPSTDKDSVAWEHPLLGTITESLDHVARLRFSAIDAPPVTGARKDDTVTLVNGDRLNGVIESLAPLISIVSGTSRIDVEPYRTSAVELNNPVLAPSGQRLWLSDGTVAAVRTVVLRSTVTLSAAHVHGARESRVPITEFEGFVPDAARLRPLSDLTVSAQEPLGSRRRLFPVRSLIGRPSVVGALDVELPGPMSCTWVLPAGARRFGAVAQLPEECWTWGDCTLVLGVLDASGTERTLAETHLSAASPEAAIAADLPSGAKHLRATLRPGPYGAIQNRVVLRRALMVVKAD